MGRLRKFAEDARLTPMIFFTSHTSPSFTLPNADNSVPRDWFQKNNCPRGTALRPQNWIVFG
jgi:hypothetical protein